MYILELICIIIISILLYNIYYHDVPYQEDMVQVKSTIDNNEYTVKDSVTKQEAADQLAKIRHKLLKLIKYLQTHYPEDERVHRVIKKFNYNNISEHFPSSNSNLTSYSINKGDKMVFCLRQHDTNKSMVDENTLMFVSLHELAHVMTISVGHEKEFWDNFKFLLKNAIKTGLYQYHPYHIKTQRYCGTEITDTPYHHDSYYYD